MPCGKEQYVEVNWPNDMDDLCNQVMSGELFRLLQIDIHVPNELMDKFSEFCPLLVRDSIPDNWFQPTCMSTKLEPGTK